MRPKYLVGLTLAILTVTPILAVVSRTIFGGGVATVLIHLLSAGFIFSRFADLDERDNASESPATPLIEKSLMLTFGVLSLVTLLAMPASQRVNLVSLTVASFWAFMTYSAYLGNFHWVRTGLQIVIVVTILMVISAIIFEEMPFIWGYYGYPSIGEAVIVGGINIVIYLVICVITAKKMKISFAEFILSKSPVIESSEAKK